MLNKRIILYLLLALVLILFISCSGKDGGETPANINNNTGDNSNNSGNAPREPSMQDWYFFRTYIDFDDNQRTRHVKINPVTQTVTPICIDPLCDHGRDCPLNAGFVSGSVQNTYITGNYFFYLAEGSGRLAAEGSNQWQLMTEILVYDMINSTVRKLAEYWDTVTFIGAAENYLYYVSPRIREDDDMLVNYIIYRADARTGNIIEIGEHLNTRRTHSNFDYPNINIIADGKIYWSATAEGRRVLYTTDLDGNNRETLNIRDGMNMYITHGEYHNGYMYHKGPTGDGIMIAAEDGREATREEIEAAIAEAIKQEGLLSEYEQQRRIRDVQLLRSLLGGDGEPEVIAESIIDFVLLSDKIYFTMIEDEPEVIEYNGAQTWNWSGGKVWGMNLDGTGKYLVADTGYNLSGGASGFFNAKNINGVDYIAWSYTDFRRGSFVPSPNTIIINASTGEWVVLSAPE
jgi:hypothetical protein